MPVSKAIIIIKLTLKNMIKSLSKFLSIVSMFFLITGSLAFTPTRAYASNTAPVLTVVSPVAGSTSGSADITLSLNTDVASNCWYDLDDTIASMSVTGGTSHT
jgi:hypothetical protein